MNRRSEAKLIEKGEPHGIPGQLNICVPDVASYRTGYGAHNRIVCGVGYDGVYVREDRRGLPDSSESQRLRVLREDWPGMRVTLRKREESDDGQTIYFDYDLKPRAGIHRI